MVLTLWSGLPEEGGEGNSLAGDFKETVEVYLFARAFDGAQEQTSFGSGLHLWCF